MTRSSLSLLCALVALLGACSIDVSGRVLLSPDMGPDIGIDMGRDMTIEVPDLGDMTVPPIDEGVDMDIDMFMPPDDMGVDMETDMFTPPDDMGDDMDTDMFMPPIDMGIDEGVDMGAPCAPTDSPYCFDSETLATCPSGTLVMTTCSLGCAGALPAQCRIVLPSNVGPLVAITDSTADLDTSTLGPIHNLFIDTDTGQILAFNDDASMSMEIRAAETLGIDHGIRYSRRAGSGSGADLGVFVFHSLAISEGTILIARGNRALVILSATSVDIRGAVLVGADTIPTMPGPGPAGGVGGDNEVAGAGSGGGTPGARPLSGLDDSGGAGGGYGRTGGAGGQGGSGLGAIPGGFGGGAYGNEELVPLRAGSGGGGGGDDDGGSGGSGGGAIQISATDWIRVTSSGIVDASGAGGEGGHATMSTMDSGAGGGGGAGGGILLEAALVTIDGYVGANGGAGGQGGQMATVPGVDGTNGSATTFPAAGSAEVGVGGAGGNGSNGDGNPVGGGDQENGGGGGGAGGRIRINNRAGTFAFAANVAPHASSGLATAGEVTATP